MNIFEHLKNSQNPIFIYGAGGQAQRVCHVLEEKGIPVEGFCVSKHDDDSRSYMGFARYDYATVKSKYPEYIFLIAVMAEVAAKIVTFLKEEGEQNEFHIMRMPFRLSNEFFSSEQYPEEKEAFAGLFQDEKSRKLVPVYWEFKENGNLLPLLHEGDGISFFDEPLLDDSITYTYIDCGAFTGDTVMQFCQFNGVNYKKIYAIDMIPFHCQQIQSFVKLAKLPRVEVLECGLWSSSEQKTMYFKESAAYLDANFFTSKDYGGGITDLVFPIIEGQITTTTLDELFLEGFKGKEENILIKLNVIGSDLAIIKGARGLIETFRPTFVIDYGIVPEDIFGIPFFLREVCAEYRFYLREKTVNGESRPVLYCI